MIRIIFRYYGYAIIIFFGVIGFSNVYAGSCVDSAAAAAQQAYTYYNSVTKVAGAHRGQMKFSLFYEKTVYSGNSCSCKKESYIATAVCKSGKWKPLQPSTVQALYSQISCTCS